MRRARDRRISRNARALSIGRDEKKEGCAGECERLGRWVAGVRPVFDTGVRRGDGGGLCARLTGLPADDEGVEVLWGTILLPNAELFGALTTTKPWQIDFEGGKERLVLRVPQGLNPSREMMKYMKVREARARGRVTARWKHRPQQKGYPLSRPRKVARIRDMKTKRTRTARRFGPRVIARQRRQQKEWD